MVKFTLNELVLIIVLLLLNKREIFEKSKEIIKIL